MSARANCWEIKKCGRQPGGPKVAELGICAAATNGSSLSGINGGTHAGRICWAVAGTLCGGKVQGTFAQKALNCMQCEFYQMVKQEQGSQFTLLPAG